jgi:hypothetical protein
MSVGRRRLVVPPEAEDFSTGAHFVNAIQPEAADQALVAALNMAGQSTSRQGGFRMPRLGSCRHHSANGGARKAASTLRATALLRALRHRPT